MHVQQKAAWFVLVVTGGTVILYGAAVPLLSWWFHRTMAEVAAPALGVFGLLGLTGFETFFYHGPRGGTTGHEPVMDERDWLLMKRAWNAGMRTFWLVFCGVGMGSWAYLYFVRGVERITVPVGLFPVILMGSAIVFMLTRSLATLHYYGWKANDAGR